MKHDSQTINLAINALHHAFGDEWEEFTRSSAAVLPALVIHDFIDANITATEYRDLIYSGNLASYARCLTKQQFQPVPLPGEGIHGNCPESTKRV